MGHYASELFPRGYDVEMREQRERDRKREQERAARHSERHEREWELMTISDEELKQEELTRRISKMLVRHNRIVNIIPAPLTLHLPDGEDKWNMGGTLENSGDSNLYLLRTYPYEEDENFDLSIKKGKASVTHRERGLYEMSLSSGNSERELRPAEELFDRLISPLETKMGLTGMSQA